MSNPLFEELPNNEFYKPQFNNYGGIYADGFGLAIALMQSDSKESSKKYYLTELFYEPHTCTLDNIEAVVKDLEKKYGYVHYNINNSNLLKRYVSIIASANKAYELNLSDGIMLLNSMKNKGYFKISNEEKAEQVWHEMKNFTDGTISHRLNAIMLALAENNPYGIDNWLDALIE